MLVWDVVKELLPPAATIFVGILGALVTFVTSSGRRRHAHMVREAKDLQEACDDGSSAHRELTELRAHHMAEYLLAAVQRPNRESQGTWVRVLPTVVRVALIVGGLSVVSAFLYTEGRSREPVHSTQWLPPWAMLGLVLLPILSISVDRTQRRLERAEKYVELGGPYGDPMTRRLEVKVRDGVLLWFIAAGVTLLAGCLAALESSDMGLWAIVAGLSIVAIWGTKVQDLRMNLRALWGSPVPKS